MVGCVVVEPVVGVKPCKSAQCWRSLTGISPPAPPPATPIIRAIVLHSPELLQRTTGTVVWTAGMVK